MGFEILNFDFDLEMVDFKLGVVVMANSNFRIVADKVVGVGIEVIKDFVVD